MADKKVSQETDLGLAGIDGTVEYRVIKSGGTYRQKYSDLFTYINGQLRIPTLQEVLDNNHSLTNGIVQIGTTAGGTSPGAGQISIGTSALNVTSIGSVGIGVNAGVGSGGLRNVLIGNSAGGGLQGTGGNIVIGDNSGSGANHASSIVLGTSTATSSSGTNSIFIGSSAGNYSGAGLAPAPINNIFLGPNAGGGNASTHNLGYNNIAIGQDSLYNNDDNTRNNIIALGNKSGYSTGHALPGGTNSIYMGEESGMNSGGNYMVALGYQAGRDTNSNNLIAIGNTAASATSGTNVVAIGAGALAGGSTGDNLIAIGNNTANAGASDNTIAIGTAAMRSADAGGVVAIGTGSMEGFDGGPNANCVAVGHDTGRSSDAIATGCVYVGTGAGRSNTARDVIALGTNAGLSNPTEGEFILASTHIRAFGSPLDASNYYSALTLSPNQTYIYIDTGDDNTLKVYRT